MAYALTDAVGDPRKRGDLESVLNDRWIQDIVVQNDSFVTIFIKSGKEQERGNLRLMSKEKKKKKGLFD